MRTSLITPPATEPLTLAEAKAHLRVDLAAEDALITSLIVAAREAFEHQTGRQLVTATWRGFLDRFPRFDHEPIEIAKPPLLTVASVLYIDSSGVQQEWDVAEYDVQVFTGAKSQRGMISPKPDFVYPVTRRVPNAVTVNFDAGYGAAADVPQEIKQLLLALVGTLYENRETVVIGKGANMVPGLGFNGWIEHDFS